MLPVLSLFGCCPETGNVRTGKRLRDGEREELLSRKDLFDDAVAQLRASKVENRRQTDDSTGVLTIPVTTAAGTAEFLRQDELMEAVELERWAYERTRSGLASKVCAHLFGLDHATQ